MFGILLCSAGMTASPASTLLTEAVVRLTVPFYDLDTFQVVWHGNYFKYFERARQALFKQAGLDIYRPEPEQRYHYPVVRTRVRHLHPLFLDDEFEVKARLTDASCKLVIAFELRNLPARRLCARAESQQVALDARDHRLCFEIPAEVRAAFGWEPPCPDR